MLMESGMRASRSCRTGLSISMQTTTACAMRTNCQFSRRPLTDPIRLPNSNQAITGSPLNCLPIGSPAHRRADAQPSPSYRSRRRILILATSWRTE